MCPEEFLGTLCHPIATEGSPPRRSIHDSDREKLGNFDTKGGGKDKGREHARIIPVGMASVCGETERLCVAVAIVVVVVVAVTNVSPSVRRLTRA